MRSAILGSLWLGLAGTGGLACTGPEIYGARAPLDDVRAESVAVGPALELLSAHLTRLPDDGLTELLLVFSAEVDPTTLTPDSFVVVREGGEFVSPERALLDPADEYDENRSVTLRGRFGSPEDDPPTAVRVIGNVYAEEGGALSGLDAPVRAYADADEIVWVEILRPDEHRCAGARQLVRTHWSDNLRGVDPEDLARVEVSFSDGSAVAPVGFDDHAGLGSEADDDGDDNVLDLCLGRDAPVSAVTIEAGVFEDAAGHPTAATTRGPSAG